MVKIRLKRMGSKKNPFYRIVVADSRRARDGKFIEQLGYYDPLTEPKTVKFDQEKAEQWIANGAKASETVQRLFKSQGYDITAKTAKKAEATEETEAVEA